MSAKAVLKRFDKAKKRKMSSWYSHMRECYEYAVPQRETFTKHSPGQKKNTHIYDSTAIIATPIYANRIQQSIMPAGSQWAKLTPGRRVNGQEMIDYAGERVTMQNALEKITDIVFEYINRSNFNARCHESLIDLAVSTAVMICEYDEDQGEIVFDAIPLSNVYLESGPKGKVTGVFWERKDNIRNILAQYPDAVLPEKLKDIEKTKPETELDIVEAMLPDKDGEYALNVMIGDDVIYEEGFGESTPFIVGRTTVIPGEVYGRGPLMRVLPDIKTLNKMAENSLKSAALAVAGVWTATDDGVINPYSITLAPGVVIPVGSNSDENPTLRPLDVGGRLDFHEMEYNRRVDNVNRALFAKPIGDIDDATKSATEIQARMQLDLQDAGADFSRLVNELAGGVIERVMYLLSREGIIPPLKIDGENIKLKFTSPVSQQHDKDEAANLMNILQTAVGMGAPLEMLNETIRVEAIPTFLMDKMSGPAELKRTPEEIEAMQQQKQQAAQAQAELAMMQQEEQGGQGAG